MSEVKIVECPRDAMQGLHDFIPTKDKVNYIQSLLEVGFDTIDFGSFVSPAAIPQLRDTAEVLGQLDISNSKSKLLAIVANTRGAIEALQYSQIKYLGFPLSISETFQQKNTNKSISEAYFIVEEIYKAALEKKVIFVVYLSMGFGNPYGDLYDMHFVKDFVSKLDSIGIKIICPSDTIGISKAEDITTLFQSLVSAFPHIEFGAHLHASPANAQQKIKAAYDAGCRRFDGAIRGFGGCPMATDKLVGNIATEIMVSLFDELHIGTGLDKNKLEIACQKADLIF